MNEFIIGIDPGKSGGMAVLTKDGVLEKVDKFKDLTLTDLYELFRHIDYVYNAFAFIENVHAMPKQGVTSVFTFGKQYGGLLMALTCFRIPYEKITPVKWQRALGCLSKGDKNVTKAKAQELFPSLKVTHAIADALLIAEYGRRSRTISR
ncbi:MAG TPA: hypothetical protein ENH82_00430 [bacterium]|nr:hypothetical protein [bacterium]